MNQHPVCPLKVAATFAAPPDDEGRAWDASRLECYGSVCAVWRPHPLDAERGSCGLTQTSQTIPDRVAVKEAAAGQHDLNLLAVEREAADGHERACALGLVFGDGICVCGRITYDDDGRPILSRQEQADRDLAEGEDRAIAQREREGREP